MFIGESRSGRSGCQNSQTLLGLPLVEGHYRQFHRTPALGRIVG
jgi:hypothetical protein